MMWVSYIDKTYDAVSIVHMFRCPGKAEAEHVRNRVQLLKDGGDAVTHLNVSEHKPNYRESDVRAIQVHDWDYMLANPPSLGKSTWWWLEGWGEPIRCRGCGTPIPVEGGTFDCTCGGEYVWASDEDGLEFLQCSECGDEFDPAEEVAEPEPTEGYSRRGEGVVR